MSTAKWRHVKGLQLFMKGFLSVITITSIFPHHYCFCNRAGKAGRAIASNFWNRLYMLRHNKPDFKALLYKCAPQGA